LTRCLNDNDIPLDVRVAGALILLFGLLSSRVLHLIENETLGSGYTLLVRAHYFYPGPGELSHPEQGAQVVDVSGHPSVEEVCLAADYSAIMFDYAVLDRPIVVYAPDWAAYRRTRGTYFDILAEPPGLVATSQDQLADLFAMGGFHSPEVTGARTRFRDRFCPHDDGHAAERVVRHVFLGQPLPPSRPQADQEG
jgi:CDP-glycerol glycerophosphotransferase